MTTGFQEGWIQNGWQERLDRLLDLLTDYDILLLDTPVGFGKERTIERWHHLLAGSGKTIYRLDCRKSQIAAYNACDFGAVVPRSIYWHHDAGAARAMVDRFADADHEWRVLIIENLHELGVEDLTYVQRRLRDLPPMANAVLTCQNMPQEWSVALIAGGQLKIIGEEQFTLDFDEFVQRMEMLCAESFPLHALRQIYGVTGGWFVAIEHAAIYILASRDRMEAAENFPDIWPDQAVWMQENIWYRLTPDEQNFLLGIAALGDAPLDMPFVRDFAGSGEAGGGVDDLLKKTPFFQCDRRGFPSLRRIAASFLRHTAQDHDRPRLSQKRAPLLKPHIALHPAGHMRAAADVAETGEAPDDKLLNLIASGETGLARRWFDTVQQERLRTAPAMLALELLGYAGIVKAWLVQEEMRAHRFCPIEEEHYTLVRAQRAAVDENIDELDRCLRLLDECSGLSGSLKAAERTLRLRCLQRRGQAQPFSSMTLAANDERRYPENFAFYCSTVLIDGAVLLDFGQAEAAARLLARAQNLAFEKLGEEAMPVIELSAMLGAAQLQAGQPDCARATMKTWALLDLSGIDQWALHSGYLTLAKLAARDGRYSDAFGLLETIDRAAEERRLHAAQAQIKTEIARIAIMAGRPLLVHHAEAWLRKILAQSGQSESMSAELAQLHAASGLAQIAIWNRDWNEALQWLDKARPLAQQFERIFELARLDRLQGHCRNAIDGDTIPFSDRTLSIGTADMETMLSEVELLRGRPAANGGASPQRAGVPDANPVTLTQKEREVLELMARGFAKPLIAQALQISPETVKWHQKNIYTKFDIHDRHNVLSRARTLGLV